MQMNNANNNEYSNNRIVEDRLEMAKKRKRNKTVSSILIMFGCVLVLVLVTYAAGLAYMWIEDKFQESANDLAAAADAVLLMTYEWGYTYGYIRYM